MYEWRITCHTSLIKSIQYKKKKKALKTFQNIEINKLFFYILSHSLIFLILEILFSFLKRESFNEKFFSVLLFTSLSYKKKGIWKENKSESFFV